MKSSLTRSGRLRWLRTGILRSHCSYPDRQVCCDDQARGYSDIHNVLWDIRDGQLRKEIPIPNPALAHTVPKCICRLAGCKRCYVAIPGATSLK